MAPGVLEFWVQVFLLFKEIGHAGKLHSRFLSVAKTFAH